MRSKLIGYHSNVSWTTVKLLSFTIPIRASTSAESLVKIGLVVSGICRFLLYCLRSAKFSHCNLRRYWTKVRHICTQCRGIIGTIKLLIHIVILKSILKFRVPNEGRFVNFAQKHNWLLWQRLLRNPKNWSRSTTCTVIPFIRWKKCENQSSRSWGTFAQFKKRN